MTPEILYAERSFAVIVKPAGLLSEGEGDGTVAGALRPVLGKLYPVHRLDRTVGGVMVYARTASAAAALSAAVAGGRFQKSYLAVVAGETPSTGEWRDHLFKDSAANKSFVVSGARKGAREAILRFETLETAKTDSGTPPSPCATAAAENSGIAAPCGTTAPCTPADALLNDTAIPGTPADALLNDTATPCTPAGTFLSTNTPCAPGGALLNDTATPCTRGNALLNDTATPGTPADALLSGNGGNETGCAVGTKNVGATGGTLSKVRVTLLTGRSHQIRVQFASRGFPLVGDGKYGSRVKAPCIALYSERVSFPHPESGKELTFFAPPPAKFPFLLFAPPPEIEHKYLIRYPDIAWLTARSGAGVREMEQTYLTAMPGETRRVRRVSENRKITYFYTRKVRQNALSAAEEEREISADEYEALLAQRDPGRSTIYKTRYSFPFGGHIAEVDVYPFWNDRAILEVEVRGEQESVLLPRELIVIREVSDDKRYKNVNLAKAIPQEPLP